MLERTPLLIHERTGEMKTSARRFAAKDPSLRKGREAYHREQQKRRDARYKQRWEAGGHWLAHLKKPPQPKGVAAQRAREAAHRARRGVKTRGVTEATRPAGRGMMERTSLLDKVLDEAGLMKLKRKSTSKTISDPEYKAARQQHRYKAAQADPDYGPRAPQRGFRGVPAHGARTAVHKAKRGTSAQPSGPQKHSKLQQALWKRVRARSRGEPWSKAQARVKYQEKRAIERTRKGLSGG